MADKYSKDRFNADRDPIKDQAKEGQERFTISREGKAFTGLDANNRNGALLEADPQDFNNQVEITKKAQRNRRIAFFGVAAIVIVGVFFAVSSLVPSNSYSPEKSTPNEPFLGLYADAPAVNVDQMTLTADGNTLKTVVGEKLGHRIAIPLDKPFADSENCRVTKPTDFALCASTTPDSPFTGTSVWLTKDAVRSELFADATNFTPVEVKGAPTAAVMKLSGLAPQQRATLVVISPDASGYIISLPADATLKDAKELAKTVFVE